MVPIKLELKNFLSYGDSVVKVDFKDHALICLSGKNGNGKSALLDAMTWALWGNARKVSGTIKADAGLIRLGQTRMVVSFEFLCGGQRYRVRREYAKTYGKPYAALDIELFRPKQKSFVSLSEKTARQTQAKIEKIVGLDFDTFINSAFLRQGQSNEFSQKTPKERKQILANILGLSQYDELSRLALEQSRVYAEESKVLKKLDEQLLAELTQEESSKKMLVEKKREIGEQEKTLKTLTKKLESKEKLRVEWLEKKYRVEQLDQDGKKLRASVEEQSAELLEYVGIWRTVHARSLQAAQLPELEKKHRALAEEEKRLREMQQQEIRLQEQLIEKKIMLQKEVARCQSACDELLNKKTLDLERVEMVSKQLEAQIKQNGKKQKKQLEKKKKIEQEIKKIDEELKSQVDLPKEFARIKEQFEKRRVFYQSFVQRGNWLTKELDELGRKKSIIEDKQDPSCPLCEQVLTARRKEFLGRMLLKQHRILQHQLARVSRVIKKLKIILLEQHQVVQKLTFMHDRYNQLTVQKEGFEKTVEELCKEMQREAVETDLIKVRKSAQAQEAKKLKKDLDKAKKEKDNVLKKDEQVLFHEKAILEITKDKDKLGYDKKVHETVMKKLQETEQALKEFDAIKEMQAQQQERRKTIIRSIEALRRCKSQSAQLEKTRAAVKFDPKALERIEAEMKTLKDEQSEVSRKKEALLRERGSLEQKQERFAALKKERKEKQKLIESAVREEKEYRFLSQTFGKDGIQALLIEQAIPEIEQEANSLLSRLTNNKSQVFIESLRDLKKGGVRESLDIHISDAHGIRPYEMFSGGEAFRIDFALRIAISKLLARRAGTALQTLIIDEGFGSQDEEGLQRLMDAIYAIQKDFVKIIVVSHLPVFKNNFPVHFVVEKNSLGSFVRIEERG